MSLLWKQGIPMGILGRNMMKNSMKSAFIHNAVAPVFIARTYSKAPFPINDKELQRQRRIEKLPKWQQWAIYFKSEKFKKSMTVYYICGFGVMCVSFYYYMRDRWYEDKQIQHVRKKYQNDPKSLSEYEYLMLKNLSQETLRPKEVKKYRIYQMMRKEFRRKHIMDKDLMFEPTPEELEEWYSKQPRRTIKKAPVLDEPIDSGSYDSKSKPKVEFSNSDNPNIVPAEDTTEFYEAKAQAYDDEIKWEERGMFLGKRRRWLMQQLKGDVLEVACGTGRNIPYLYPERINSITFMDSAKNMVEITRKKFRDAFPNFKKAGFTVGKAEDLVKLAGDESTAFKYDTIVEAFGLCAHEDPVLALKNMGKLLKPGGRIVLLEHGRSTWSFVNNHLDFRSEKRMKTWACRWNLDIGELIDEAGLDITYEKRVHLGSTWMLVCKRPEDPINSDEKPFLNKLMGTEPKPLSRGK
ncbi:S-adenosyl-L-methionine-dependent methyltransferase [Scheffersomyces xylosifermentans]|uniref:S-adenosyl-L-methionine-dependent methyltransferase n=1 Tax=Scheffersomyces xylosifermentans TaxID=1304137 RepID=UPI00315CC1BA